MKIKSAKELDWRMALKAGQDIVKQCEDAFYAPPEAVDLHLHRIRHVCAAMDALADALRLQRAGGKPGRVEPA